MCPLKEQLGADQVLATILGLGDDSYKSVQNLSRTLYIQTTVRPV